jgi:uncharacterized protein YndB with AHSA1/START domain
MADRNEPIIIERTFKAPIATVWKAISDHETMRKWYFDLAEFKPVVGFKFQFTAVGEDGMKTFVHQCEVKEVIEEKKLSYSWRYEGYPGDTLVTWELFGEGDKTRLKLTHTGLGTFPAESQDLKRENFVAGWTDIVGRNLKEFLES